MMAAVQPKLLFSPLPREALHHESENPVAADHRGPDCAAGGIQLEHAGRALRRVAGRDRSPGAAGRADAGDRKSTRLNSSHLVISYAVFCLKKKKRLYCSPFTVALSILY